MADEPDPDAIPAQDPRQLAIDAARDPNALKSAVDGLDPVKAPLAAFLKEIGAGGSGRGDQGCKSGKLGVNLLCFGPGK
jgi:hypothetical protein